MDSSLTIIYITGRGHSGSTLLDLILSSHSSITSVGELKMLAPARAKKRPSIYKQCTCGAETSRKCDFWRNVDRQMTASDKMSLWNTNPDDNNPELSKLANKAIFNAVNKVSGKHFIVDSSKNLDRLENLLKSDIAEVRTIHLLRSPHGVAYSNLKRNRDWQQHVRNVTRGTVKTRKLLANIDHHTVRYEALCLRPREVIEEILDWLGLPFEEKMLDWAGHEHHNFAGNPMRYSENSTISIDTEWKKKLSFSQKLYISWKTLPTRFNGTTLYDIFPKLWK